MSAFAPVWRKIAGVYVFLAAFNAAAWVLALLAFRGQPALLGMALLAYTFGLRHAVDADHIASIDCVTRKLMHDGKRPVSVGLFFSLGHSTIVVLLAGLIALSAGAVRAHIPQLQSGGNIVGTLVSVAFLVAIALINVRVLRDTLRNRNAEVQPEQRGLLSRVLRPVLRMVDASWKMYPVGVLFGLGFDTATEIGLLGIAAIEAGRGLPVVDIMIFPLLFTVGMSLLDTTDGILMLGAYGWAFVKPERKLRYNVTVTSISIIAAVFVGGLEAINLLAGQFGWGGGLWSLAALAGNHLGTLGALIVALFLGGWLLSVVASRLRGPEPLSS